MTGCSQDRQQQRDPLANADPLKGPVPASIGAPTPGPIPPPGPGPATPLPPVSAVGPASSPAALAAASPQPLDPSRELRIGNPTPPPINSGTWQGAGTAVASAVRPLDPPQVTLTRGVAATTGRIATYEQAQAILAGRGIKWQRLETLAGNGWKFTCSVPNRTNQLISRTYEGQATTSLGAIQAVLDQMDKDAANNL